MHTAGIWIAAALAVIVLLLLRSEWEKRQLCVETYQVKTDKLRKGTRVLFLSDLHSVQFGKANARLLRAIDGQKPDAVLIGGDLITCSKRKQNPPHTSIALHLLKELCAKYPVYYAEGNHEARMAQRFPDAYQMYMDHLIQLGVSYIRNDCDVFDTEKLLEDTADDLNLYSVSMEPRFFRALPPGFGRKEPIEEGYLKQKLGEPDRAQFNILLMHSPLYFKEAAEWGADLVLSGHFHGGTIYLPKIGGLMTPQLQFFVRECAGRFRKNGADMIVNRGLGTHSIRIRLNDLPELSCIDIVPEKKCRDTMPEKNCRIAAAED